MQQNVCRSQPRPNCPSLKSSRKCNCSVFPGQSPPTQWWFITFRTLSCLNLHCQLKKCCHYWQSKSHQITTFKKLFFFLIFSLCLFTIFIIDSIIPKYICMYIICYFQCSFTDSMWKMVKVLKNLNRTLIELWHTTWFFFIFSPKNRPRQNFGGNKKWIEFSFNHT